MPRQERSEHFDRNVGGWRRETSIVTPTESGRRGIDFPRRPLRIAESILLQSGNQTQASINLQFAALKCPVRSPQAHCIVAKSFEATPVSTLVAACRLLLISISLYGFLNKPWQSNRNILMNQIGGKAVILRASHIHDGYGYPSLRSHRYD